MKTFWPLYFVAIAFFAIAPQFLNSNYENFYSMCILGWGFAIAAGLKLIAAVDNSFKKRSSISSKT